MTYDGEPGFSALLTWVIHHYPGGERQLLTDTDVHRRTPQRWRSQGAPERGSRALDAVDAAARTELPGYPPAGYPGGGLPVLVGERITEDNPDGRETPSDHLVAGSDTPLHDTALYDTGLQDSPVPATAFPATPVPDTPLPDIGAAAGPLSAPVPRSRSRRRTLLPWGLVAVLTAIVVLEVLRLAAPADDIASGSSPSSSPLAPPGAFVALVDLSGLAEDADPFIGSYTQPAVQRNCDGVICSGSPRRISNHFAGDPLFFSCQAAGEWVEVGPPAQPGWYGSSDWLKLVTADGDRWISNTWVLRSGLADADVPTCS